MLNTETFLDELKKRCRDDNCSPVVVICLDNITQKLFIANSMGLTDRQVFEILKDSTIVIAEQINQDKSAAGSAKILDPTKLRPLG